MSQPHLIKLKPDDVNKIRDTLSNCNKKSIDGLSGISKVEADDTYKPVEA